jgi:hypothetical protein
MLRRLHGLEVGAELGDLLGEVVLIEGAEVDAAEGGDGAGGAEFELGVVGLHHALGFVEAGPQEATQGGDVTGFRAPFAA